MGKRKHKPANATTCKRHNMLTTLTFTLLVLCSFASHIACCGVGCILPVVVGLRGVFRVAASQLRHLVFRGIHFAWQLRHLVLLGVVGLLLHGFT